MNAFVGRVFTVGQEFNPNEIDTVHGQSSQINIAELKNLTFKNLRMWNCEKCDFRLLYFRDFSNLVWIDLYMNKIKNASFIAQCRNAELVNLCDNQIQHLDFLLDLLKLRGFYINRNKIQDIEEFVYLADKQNLTAIQANGNPCGEKHLEYIQPILGMKIACFERVKDNIDYLEPHQKWLRKLEDIRAKKK